MFNRGAKKYVVLQDHVPLREQRAIERALVRVLPPVYPAQAFVEQLNQDLVEEARQQYATRMTKTNQTLNLLGIFSGGVLSVVGGITIWLLFQREHEKTESDLPVLTRRQTTIPAISA
jgi:acyl-coenzyme A thioesterase PaaI-like protein